jgi:hypothetical protein
MTGDIAPVSFLPLKNCEPRGGVEGRTAADPRGRNYNHRSHQPSDGLYVFFPVTISHTTKQADSNTTNASSHNKKSNMSV